MARGHPYHATAATARDLGPADRGATHLEPHVNRQQTRARRGAVVLSLAVAAGLTACSPITTQKPYAASDGLRVEVGEDLTVQNLLVVTAEQGARGAVQGGIVNNSATDATVRIDTLTFDVPAGSTVLLGGTHGEDAFLDAVAVAPGANLPLTVGTAGSETEVPVPVLDGTLPEYAELVPSES